MKLQHRLPCIGRPVDRRRFLTLSAGTAIASLPGRSIMASTGTWPSTSTPIQTGNGEWTYQIIPHWGELPAGVTFGGTHGAIATDKAGLLYVSTQSATGILVYDLEGNLHRRIDSEYPEIHSMVHTEEAGQEYFYVTVQKGNPHENWIFLKLLTDGTVVKKITAPREAGFSTPNEWRITAAVPGPDGSIYIANGYGDSRIFKFDQHGNYQLAFAGKGSEDGKCDCCHGISVDTRYDQPLLLVCDRENRRLCHFDFDGKFVGIVAEHLRRPCQVSFYGDCAVVSELEGRVTILDKQGTTVAFLGDNPDKSQWANYAIPPADIAPAFFSAAHGCFIDRDANIYVSDWNQSGRITKLKRKEIRRIS